MEIPEDEDELPEKYLCEVCDPASHKELLDKVARGERPWEERAKERERQEQEKKDRKKKGGKKGKGGKKAKTSEVKSKDGEVANDDSTMVVEEAEPVKEINPQTAPSEIKDKAGETKSKTGDTKNKAGDTKSKESVQKKSTQQSESSGSNKRKARSESANGRATDAGKVSVRVHKYQTVSLTIDRNHSQRLESCQFRNPKTNDHPLLIGSLMRRRRRSVNQGISISTRPNLLATWRNCEMKFEDVRPMLS